MKKLIIAIISVMIISILCGCTDKSTESIHYWKIENNTVVEISEDEYEVNKYDSNYKYGNGMDMQYDAIRLYTEEN